MRRTHSVSLNEGRVRANEVSEGHAVRVCTDGLGGIEKRQPALAVRLRELGLRPGAELVMGRKTAGGGRVVTVGSCRYAVDLATLRDVEVER